MKKERKPESFIHRPRFPGGKKGLDDFIKQNLRYPEEALKNKIEGIVSVEFDVDVFGAVDEVRVRHGLGYGCDEEAIRLVKLLKYERKKYKGLRVTFHEVLNIHFSITPAVDPVTRLSYQYKENPGAGKSETYSITIKTTE